jgi:hypothetical protein
MWDTPEGVRTLVGEERAIYVDCVRRLLSEAFRGAKPRYAFRAARDASFYSLTSVDALLVLRAVVTALLTSAPAPELTSLYESAAFCALKQRAHTFCDADCSALTKMCRGLPSVLESVWITTSKDASDVSSDAESTEIYDIDGTQLSLRASDAEIQARILLLKRFGVCFFQDTFTEAIFHDTDFENEALMAKASDEMRRRMQVSISKEYMAQSVAQVDALRNSFQKDLIESGRENLAEQDLRLALVASISAVLDLK